MLIWLQHLLKSTLVFSLSYDLSPAHAEENLFCNLNQYRQQEQGEHIQEQGEHIQIKKIYQIIKSELQLKEDYRHFRTRQRSAVYVQNERTCRDSLFAMAPVTEAAHFIHLVTFSVLFQKSAADVPMTMGTHEICFIHK